MSRLDKFLSALGLARASRVAGLEKSVDEMSKYSSALEGALEALGASVLHDNDDYMNNRCDTKVVLIVAGDRIRVIGNLFVKGVSMIRRPGTTGFICDRNIVMSPQSEVRFSPEQVQP